MRGDITNGWVSLANGFPPSMNTEDDPTRLKPFESPEVYGVDCGTNFLLQAGTIPIGTANNVITKVVSGYNYSWFYNRLWRSSGTTLFYGAPEYDDKFVNQGLSRTALDSDIITFLPCLQNSMWVATAIGSQILGHTAGENEWAEVKRLFQEFSVPASGQALVLSGIPVVCNDKGVFSFDGNKIKEWTRPIRFNLDGFANKPILADFTKGWIIGADSFVVDTQMEKLFDFTQGNEFLNLFTSRTLAQSDGYGPFEVTDIAFIVQHKNDLDSCIPWQAKMEENAWEDQMSVNCPYQQDGLTRIEIPFDSPLRVGHRFSLRVHDLDNEIAIREIQVCVRNLALGSFSGT